MGAATFMSGCLSEDLPASSTILRYAHANFDNDDSFGGLTSGLQIADAIVQTAQIVAGGASIANGGIGIVSFPRQLPGDAGAVQGFISGWRTIGLKYSGANAWVCWSHCRNPSCQVFAPAGDQCSLSA